MPNVIRVDQEASFNCEKFMSICDNFWITLQYSGVESHNSIAKGERYHAPLRRIYKLLTNNNPNLTKSLALRYALKGINDTANINGLVPSLLVFGVVPSFPLTNRSLPNQRARLQAIVEARLEMGRIISEQRITRALRSKLPPAVINHVKAADDVLVFREKAIRWIGPYKVSRVEDKMVFVSDGK